METGECALEHVSWLSVQCVTSLLVFSPHCCVKTLTDVVASGARDTPSVGFNLKSVRRLSRYWRSLPHQLELFALSSSLDFRLLRLQGQVCLGSLIQVRESFLLLKSSLISCDQSLLQTSLLDVNFGAPRHFRGKRTS